MFWNSSLLKGIRYVFLIPFQIIILWIYSSMLGGVLLLLIDLKVYSIWIFFLLVTLLFFLKEICLLLLGWIQILLNFTSIKFSPNINFWKVSLLIIWCLYFLSVIYEVWFINSDNSGFIFKVLAVGIHFYFITYGIILVTTQNDVYEKLNKVWEEILGYINIKFHAVFPIKNKKNSENKDKIWSIKDKEKSINKNDQWYYTIPLWRFFLLEFLTAGLYWLYWTHKNLQEAAKIDWEKYTGWTWISLLGPYPSILQNFWHSKPLTVFAGFCLNALLISWPIISIWLIQSHKSTNQEYSYGGIFAIPFIVEQIRNVLYWNSFLESVWYIVVLCIILGTFMYFITFPVIVAQYYAKKIHTIRWVQKYTAKFWIFESILYISAVGFIYLWILFAQDANITSPNLKENIVTISEKKEASWTIYASSTWSFQFLTPGDVNFSRKEIEGEIIDTYESSLQDVDIIFIIDHNTLDKSKNLDSLPIKSVYEVFSKRYWAVDIISYDEKNWEAFFLIKLKDKGPQSIFIKWRILKSTNEVYMVYSAYPDKSNESFSDKFIESFKLNTQAISYKESCPISVKYRIYGKVDVCSTNFTKLSNFWNRIVTGAWYDEANEYLIIGLQNTNYHYCWLPRIIWQSLLDSTDVDNYYINNLKWSYDCRLWGTTPKY